MLVTIPVIHNMMWADRKGVLKEFEMASAGSSPVKLVTCYIKLRSYRLYFSEVII